MKRCRIWSRFLNAGDDENHPRFPRLYIAGPGDPATGMRLKFFAPENDVLALFRRTVPILEKHGAVR